MWAPPPDLTVSEWADAERRLSPESSAKPGKYSTGVTEYARGVMDAFNDPKVKRIVGMFSAQVAKALALDTKIPTPSGWTSIGEISRGDVVFDASGAQCSVVAVSQIEENRKCFRVLFEDGSFIVAADDHQWEVIVRGCSASKVLTTAEMLAGGIRRNSAWNYRIRCAAPIDTPPAELPVSPYLLGCWLGDGSSAGPRITVDTRDGVMGLILEECCGLATVAHDKRFPHMATISPGGRRTTWVDGKCRRGHAQTAQSEGPGYCRKCKVLHSQKTQGRISEVPAMGISVGEKLTELGLRRNKHIPAMYLRASAAQRWELLQGLMDTDGTATKSGHCSFTTILKRLAGDVFELATSLGIKPQLKRKTGTYKGALYISWMVGFTAYREQPVFRLTRKQDRLRSESDKGCRPTESRARSIIGIEQVDSVPVRCIAVDSPTHLFLAGESMVPTHNTTIIENVIGYHVHHDPSPIMVVQPTLEIAEAFSKDRLAPMIRDTPALKARFAEAGSKTSGDTLLHKKFPGGAVTVAGANSFNSLASRPIRIVLGDEAAKWRPNEKGSPFRQVGVRVRAFWNSKLAFFSTPTDAAPDNEFNQLWEESDKQIRFAVCPHCKEYGVFTYDETEAWLPTSAVVPRIVLEWQEDAPLKLEDGRTIRRAGMAWFRCCSCNGRLDDSERVRADRAGEWRATQPFRGTAGFWGWQAISPFSKALDIANEWLSSLGSPTTMQSAKNETFGLPWAQSGDAPEWKRLFDRADVSYSLGTVPDGALFLTAGADVQSDRIEVQVIGWGRRRQCWLVDYVVLDGDTRRAEVWSDLDRVLGTVYRNDAGADFEIKKLCVDTGYEAERAYEWARQHRYGPVALVKGGPDSQTALVAAPSPVEITHQGKKLATGLKLHLLNVGEFKKDLYARLSLDLPNQEKGEEYPDGFFHFCRLNDTEEYCRQLTAEQLMTRRTRGNYTKREWEKTRPRNEAMDTWNYAAAGRVMLGADRFDEDLWAQLEMMAKCPAPVGAAAPPPQPQRQGGDWFGDRGRSWF
jgi:phage terminase large subunit GpA-like protein